MNKCAIVILFLCGSLFAQFNQDTLKRWMKTGPSFEFILIDLRGQSDNITSVIANDQCKPYNLVWLDEFKERIPKIPKEKHVVVYCRSGARSSQAYSYLIGEGYTNVHDAGGFAAWTDTVRPFTGDAIMADSLLPAPSMIPGTGTKYPRLSKRTGQHYNAAYLRNQFSTFRCFSLDGRCVRNRSIAEGVVITLKRVN